jgi:hypothetical protein
MDRQAIVDAVDRGLTRIQDLAQSIADEIAAIDTSPNLERATTAELHAELAARADAGGYAAQRPGDQTPPEQPQDG